MTTARSLLVVLVAVAAFASCVWTVAWPASGVSNGLALTPPLGWNGFNHYGRDVTASIVKAQAQALVSSGMKADGYVYVNLDGGWDLLQRDAQGNLQPDPTKFPNGIAPIAAYVHSLGLKLGIYTSAGTTNCAGTSAGSWGHYQQDANTFATWGVDFVKVDWCAVPMDQYPGMTEVQVAQDLYGQFEQALQSTGRPMVYSLSTNSPDLAAWTWASTVGNMWRTTSDIKDTYASMLATFQANVQHASAAAPGGWNDSDMLDVGNAGMTANEDRTHFSLWAEMASPLLAGNDLTSMSSTTRHILTNPKVIAVDQDSLGRQGYVVAHANGYWILNKPLADGSCAVVLFNSTNTRAVLSTSAAQVGLPAAPQYDVDHLWRDLTTTTSGTISADVRPHAVAMMRVASSQS